MPRDDALPSRVLDFGPSQGIGRMHEGSIPGPNLKPCFLSKTKASATTSCNRSISVQGVEARVSHAEAAIGLGHVVEVAQVLETW